MATGVSVSVETSKAEEEQALAFMGKVRKGGRNVHIDTFVAARSWPEAFKKANPSVLR